ncbi:MAG: UvrD-helicase domain-containing protein [Acidobacteriota bacterium]|nr:UvrD-helicase domain-containing protein [Acidobacteriota bacterium]MDH3784766.1 UvrD-helicase domain-containing protein [Acidobacteriota bacterium]
MAAQNTLNPAQREAVEHGDGPMLILAGAGSGKTRVITGRVAELIRRGVRPQAIVAVSFTNKAANEMAERMKPLVGSRQTAKLRMSTFHRFGLGLLREESRSIGYGSRFVIFDQGDSLGLVKEILRARYRGGAARRLDPMSILARISNWKSAIVRPDAIEETDEPYQDTARQIYPEYQERLAAMRAFDFDDLVCRPVQMLREDGELRRRWQERIDHLLVDEFQDTSEVQLELVKLLANERRNVCVVGDDDQSIYSWRGANVDNILQFEKHFPGTRVVKLETNYRSSASILEVANAVIGNSNTRRHEKKLRAARQDGDRVRRCMTEDPAAESRFVAREIRQLHDEDAVPLENMAVLYRSNSQARLIEQALTEGAIPYQVYGGQQFLDRKEVKDFAAYLRVVVNPYDEISLRRILNYPSRGIGTRSVQRLEAYAESRRMPFTGACADPGDIGDLPDAARAALTNLEGLFRRARETMKSSGALHVAARDLLEQIALRRALDDSAEGGDSGEARYQNVLALLNWIERYERDTPRTTRSLQDFLQRVTLKGDTANDAEPTRGVTLCTLHAAKGLEFGVVFLIGCIEGQLPHSRTTDPRANEATTADLEEERRLFYVGVTRAQDRLYLVAPRSRALRGKTAEVTPSRYLDDLPDDQIEDYEREDQRDFSASEVSSMIKSFLKSRREQASRESCS